MNLVSEDIAEAMNVTAIDFEHGTNELAEAGLTTLPSLHVKTPERPARTSGSGAQLRRIATTRVASCQLFELFAIGTRFTHLIRLFRKRCEKQVTIEAEIGYGSISPVRLFNVL